MIKALVGMRFEAEDGLQKSKREEIVRNRGEKEWSESSLDRWYCLHVHIMNLFSPGDSSCNSASSTSGIKFTII